MSNTPERPQNKNAKDPESVPKNGGESSGIGDGVDIKEQVSTANIPKKSSVDVNNQSSENNEDPFKERRDLILSHKEAQAGSPDDIAACGEEDIGAGLELLVTRNDTDKS